MYDEAGYLLYVVIMVLIFLIPLLQCIFGHKEKIHKIKKARHKHKNYRRETHTIEAWCDFPNGNWETMETVTSTRRKPQQAPSPRERVEAMKR